MTDIPTASTRWRSTPAPRPDPATGARQTPIYQTTAYVFRDADHAAALFNLQEVGYIYSRLTNPTVSVLQERIATLEGGVGAVACSSGHAAQIMALFPLMRPGDNVVASTRLYGGTFTQFTHTIRRFGWSANFVDFDDLAALEAAIDDRHPRDLLRVDRQPRRLCHRPRRPSPRSPSGRRAADRRQHLGDALALPAVRAGRRPRRALHDEVPDRQRHRRPAAPWSIPAGSTGPPRASSRRSPSPSPPTTA